MLTARFDLDFHPVARNYDSMGYFQVRYDSRVVNNERKLFIRLATAVQVRIPNILFQHLIDALFVIFLLKDFYFQKVVHDTVYECSLLS